MADSALAANLRDVAFTTPVPFTDDAEAIRHDALTDNLARLSEAGARLFIPCGNTGEYYSLTDEERIAIVETHVAATDEGATVVAGAAGSVPEVTRLAAAYEDAGADALMVMHPDHTYVHERGLVEYYRRICEATDLGVVLYKRGPELTRGVLEEVTRLDSVVAVKFAVGDIAAFAGTVVDAPDDVVWLDGLAERYARSFALEGATGYTTGVGNFAPEATLALFDAIEAGDDDRARRIQALLRPLEELRDEPGEANAVAGANNVPAVKHGLDLAGWTGGSVRAPLVGLSTADERRVAEECARIEAAGFDEFGGLDEDAE